MIHIHQVTDYSVRENKLVQIHHLKTCNVPSSSDPGGILKTVKYETWITLESIQLMEVEHDATEEKDCD